MKMLSATDGLSECKTPKDVLVFAATTGNLAFAFGTNEVFSIYFWGRKNDETKLASSGAIVVPCALASVATAVYQTLLCAVLGADAININSYQA